MKALVLAAGTGTRLGSAAGAGPKPLVEVAGTTPLEHSLAWLAELGVERIWINVHAHADRIRERIGRQVQGVPVSYSYETVLLGTAGAWKHLETEWTDTSLVVYGDNLMRFDLRALLATHGRAGAAVTVALFDASHHMNTGAAGGRAQLRHGRITSFVEGGAAGLVNAGVYAVEPGVRERLSPGFSDFGHDVLPVLAARGELAGHVVEPEGWCLGVDTPERLQRARDLLRRGGTVSADDALAARLRAQAAT